METASTFASFVGAFLWLTCVAIPFIHLVRLGQEEESFWRIMIGCWIRVSLLSIAGTALLLLPRLLA